MSTGSMRNALKQTTSQNILQRARARLMSNTDQLPQGYYKAISLIQPPIAPRRLDPVELKKTKAFDISLRTDSLVTRYGRRNPDSYDIPIDLAGSVEDLKRYHPAFEFAERQLSRMDELGETLEESEKMLDEIIKAERVKEFEERRTRAKSAAAEGPDCQTQVMTADVAREMADWSGKFKLVPYERWSFGARQSLDHWIGINILNWSEPLWDNVAFGLAEDARLCLNEIVTVRNAIFPETIDPRKEAMKSSTITSPNMNELTRDLVEWESKAASDGKYEDWAPADQTAFDEFCFRALSDGDGNGNGQGENNIERMSEETREEFLEHARSVLLGGAVGDVSEEEEKTLYGNTEDGRRLEDLEYPELVKEFVDRGLTVGVDELLAGDEEYIEGDSRAEVADREAVNRGVMAERGEAMEGFREMYEKGVMGLEVGQGEGLEEVEDEEEDAPFVPIWKQY